MPNTKRHTYASLKSKREGIEKQEENKKEFSWKYTYTCSNCGNKYGSDYEEQKRFCPTCHYKEMRKDHYKTSKFREWYQDK